MKPRIFVMSSLVLVLVLLGSSQVQLTVAQALSISPGNEPNSLVFTLEVPPLHITQDSDGLALPSIEGFDVSGTPASPLLQRWQGKVPGDEKQDAHHKHVKQQHKDVDELGWVWIMVRPKGDH